MCFTGDMQPTKDIILIKVDAPKEQTASGIFIKEDWKSLPPFGEVLAVGPDVTGVEVGDRVLFERYGSLVLNKEERLCKESHILAKVVDA